MKNALIIFIMIFTTQLAVAQKYYTKDGKIDFISDAPLEKIDGKNTKALCVIDTETGKMEWSLLVRAFKFKKALMEEHFNENYMESSKYPKATFKGMLTEGTVNWSQDGIYNVRVVGELSLHGQSNRITVPAQIVIADGNISTSSMFSIKISNYKIDIPTIVEGKIAEEVEIKVDANLKAL